MTVGQQTTMGIHRQGAAGRQRAGLDESAAFTFATKSQILQFNQHRWGKAVIQLGDIDIRQRQQNTRAQRKRINIPYSRL